MRTLDSVWRALDTTVSSGWAPGLVAGVRRDGETVFHATGTYAFGSPRAMTARTPFRIASISKPIGGVLAALLIDDGLLDPDDPVERWLPEFANPRVLTDPTAPLTETVPAQRPITVRHLLTLTHGQGGVFGETPIGSAMRRIGLGPVPPRLSPDEFVAQIAALPLAHQPGERWMYQTGSDLLSILLARAAGLPLHELLRRRITEPLGMTSTFFVAAPDSLPTSYRPTPEGLVVYDEYDQAFSEPPPFETLSGGLVSTVPDILAFFSALADGTILSERMRDQLTSDQLSPRQRAGIIEMNGPSTSWGWQLSVDLAGGPAWKAPGRYGWTGGAGTAAFVDPVRNSIGVVFTQRFMSGPGENFAYFYEPLAAV